MLHTPFGCSSWGRHTYRRLCTRSSPHSSSCTIRSGRFRPGAQAASFARRQKPFPSQVWFAPHSSPRHAKVHSPFWQLPSPSLVLVLVPRSRRPSRRSSPWSTSRTGCIARPLHSRRPSYTRAYKARPAVGTSRPLRTRHPSNRDRRRRDSCTFPAGRSRRPTYKPSNRIPACRFCPFRTRRRSCRASGTDRIPYRARVAVRTSL